MTDAELERRLSNLIAKQYSQKFAAMHGMGDMPCAETMEGLDGFFSNIVKSVKNTIVKPIQAVAAVTKSLIKGNVAEVAKQQLGDFKTNLIADVKTIAPVAAVVANVIPGVGQVIAVGIAAAGAALKAKEQADKQKAAAKQQAAEAAAAEADARNQLENAKAAASKQGEAEAQVKLDQASALVLQAQDAAAQAAALQTQAQNIATTAQSAQNAQQSGLIVPGMTPNEIATQITRQQLADSGVGMNSPEAQQLIYDYVSSQSGQMKTAQASTAGGLDSSLTQYAPYFIGGAALLYLVTRK